MEQAEEIAARDAESENKRVEWKAEAAKELENWHAKQNEVINIHLYGKRIDNLITWQFNEILLCNEQIRQ